MKLSVFRFTYNIFFSPMHVRKKIKGLSLIEMLIAVGVLSTISAIGFTQYQKHKRKALQNEAKQNLSLVYQAQRIHYSESNQYDPSLKKIRAIPSRMIRYNVGGLWGTTAPSSFVSYANDINCCDGSNTLPCLHPNPGKTPSSSLCSITTPCYGGSSSAMSSIINSHASITVVDNQLRPPDGAFKFFAVGCTSSSLRDSNELDIWSVTHRRFFKNERDGT